MRKKEIAFCHTVCMTYTDSSGKRQMVTHTNSRRLASKSNNTQKMAQDYAKKFEQQILEEYQHDNKIEKQEKIEKSDPSA